MGIRLIIVTLMMGMVSGCTMLGLAAGAGGGYYASQKMSEKEDKDKAVMKDEIERETMKQMEIRRVQSSQQDNILAGDISRQLLGGGLTRSLSVHVVVQGGVATIFGTVPSEIVADRAVAVVGNAPGINQVISNLMVVEARITPTGVTRKHQARPPVPVAPRRRARQPNPSGQGGTPPPQAYVPQPGRPVAAYAPVQPVMNPAPVPPQQLRMNMPPQAYDRNIPPGAISPRVYDIPAPSPEESLKALLQNNEQQNYGPSYGGNSYPAPYGMPAQGQPAYSASQEYNNYGQNYGQEYDQEMDGEADDGTIPRTLPQFSGGDGDEEEGEFDEPEG